MTHQFCTVQDEGRLRIVTLNRPEVLNALHADANDELSAVWDEFAARDDLWVGIITGAGGRAFSAGNDLKVQAAGKRALSALMWMAPRAGFRVRTIRTQRLCTFRWLRRVWIWRR